MADHKKTTSSGSRGQAATSAPDAIAHLERVAAEHEKIASVVRQLAKGLANVTGWTSTPPLPTKAKGRKAGRKPMSAAARKLISDKAKKRWAEKRAEDERLGVRR